MALEHAPEPGARRTTWRQRALVFLAAAWLAVGGYGAFLYVHQYWLGPSVLDQSRATSLRASPPSAVGLVRGWEFRPDPTDTGRGAHWALDSSSDGWRPVTVPHVFQPNPRASDYRGSVGWYRLRFMEPITPAGFHWALRFEEIRRRGQVWLNGRAIGSTQDPYTPSTLQVGGLVRSAENTLVVRVDGRKRSYDPPEGWWNWNGIVRPVTLIPQGPVRLENVAVLPHLHCKRAGVCSGGVLVDGYLMDPTPGPRSVRVALTLESPRGSRTLAHHDFAPTPSGDSRRHIRFAVPLSGRPELWWPGRARLYAASVTTTVRSVPSRATVAQVDRLTVGMRLIAVRRGRLTVNGRIVNLRGISMHDDIPGHGAALTERDFDSIVHDVRAVRANVLRAHYLLSEGLLRRLDRAGILVWAENPLWRSSTWLKSRTNRAAALAMLRRTVLAARTHASVLVDSVGNELANFPSRQPWVSDYLSRAAGMARALNPAAPVALVIEGAEAVRGQAVYRNFDVLGLNVYYGWYYGGIGDLGPYLRRMRSAYRRAALVATEFGVEAFFHGRPTQRGSYEFQTRWLRRTLRELDRSGEVSGKLYWTLREFRVYPGFGGGVSDALRVRHRQPYAGHPNSLHAKGLLTYRGDRKPAWYVLRAAYARTPTYP